MIFRSDPLLRFDFLRVKLFSLPLAVVLLGGLPSLGFGADEIKLAIDTGSIADGIFPHGQNASLGVSLENRMKVEVKLNIDWRLETDEKKAIASLAQEKILLAGEKARVTFERQLPEPGFYWVTVTCGLLELEVVRTGGRQLVGPRFKSRRSDSSRRTRRKRLRRMFPPATRRSRWSTRSAPGRGRTRSRR